MSALAVEPTSFDRRTDTRTRREPARRRPEVARRATGPSALGAPAPGVSRPLDLDRFLRDDLLTEDLRPAGAAHAALPGGCRERVEWRLTERGMAVLVALVAVLVVASVLVLGAQFLQITASDAMVAAGR